MITIRRLTNSLAGRSSFLGDLGTSMATQVFVVACNLATLKLAASLMSVEGVGEFVLVRRVLVFLTPLLLLGLGVGLPRSIGRHNAMAQQSTYGTGLLLSGWLLGTSAAILMAAAVALFPEATAKLLLGSSDNARLVRPLALMILGNQLFMLVYAIRRGRLEIQKANLLQATQIALLPMLVVLWRGEQGAIAALEAMGAATCLVAGVASVRMLTTIDIRPALKHARQALVELVSYGAPRVPGDFAAAGMYAIGPILVAHQLDLQAAGLLAVGMSMLTVLAAAFSPIGLVLLPRLSQHLAGGDEHLVQRRLPVLLGAAIYLASVVALAGAFFGNTWIQWILSDAFSFPPGDLMFLMLAAGANVVFVLLRTVIDAACFRPVNAIHAAASLGVLVGTWSVATRVEPSDAFRSICIAIAASFLTLAVLTLIAVARRFSLRPTRAAVLSWGTVQLLVLGVGLGLRALAGDATLFMLIGLQLLFAAAWVGLLQVLHVGWWRQVVQLIGGGFRTPQGDIIGAQATVSATARHVACTNPVVSKYSHCAEEEVERAVPR